MYTARSTPPRSLAIAGRREPAPLWPTRSTGGSSGASTPSTATRNPRSRSTSATRLHANGPVNALLTRTNPTSVIVLPELVEHGLGVGAQRPADEPHLARRTRQPRDRSLHDDAVDFDEHMARDDVRIG